MRQSFDFPDTRPPQERLPIAALSVFMGGCPIDSLFMLLGGSVYH
jgi:hypothetical protein